MAATRRGAAQIPSADEAVRRDGNSDGRIDRSKQPDRNAERRLSERLCQPGHQRQSDARPATGPIRGKFYSGCRRMGEERFTEPQRRARTTGKLAVPDLL